MPTTETWHCASSEWQCWETKESRKNLLEYPSCITRQHWCGHQQVHTCTGEIPGFVSVKDAGQVLRALRSHGHPTTPLRCFSASCSLPHFSGPQSAPEWTSGKMWSHSSAEKAGQSQPVDDAMLRWVRSTPGKGLWVIFCPCCLHVTFSTTAQAGH